MTFLVKIPFFANLMQHASRCIWVRNAFGTNIHTSYVVVSLSQERYGTGTGMFVLYVGKRYSYGRFMSLGTLFLSYYSNLQHCCRTYLRKDTDTEALCPIFCRTNSNLHSCCRKHKKAMGVLESSHKITSVVFDTSNHKRFSATNYFPLSPLPLKDEALRCRK